MTVLLVLLCVVVVAAAVLVCVEEGWLPCGWPWVRRSRLDAMTERWVRSVGEGLLVALDLGQAKRDLAAAEARIGLLHHTQDLITDIQTQDPNPLTKPVTTTTGDAA